MCAVIVASEDVGAGALDPDEPAVDKRMDFPNLGCRDANSFAGSYTSSLTVALVSGP